MEIVINISNALYNRILDKVYSKADLQHVCGAIVYGTPLPKGHGRLIDADNTLAKAWTNFYKHEDEWEKKDNNYLPFGRMYEQNGFECCQQTIVNAPTIIEGSESE